MTDGPDLGTGASAADWDADLYERRHGFVHREAADLVDLLDPSPGDRVLDLGCGTGHLAADLRDRGAAVVGLDRSAEMLHEARRRYDGLPVIRGDARWLPVHRSLDGVFSNATLHWVPPDDAEPAARAIHSALRPGGRFVAELGGEGNVATISEAVEASLRDNGHDPTGRNPWYFPSLGEYATVLETAGFEVRYARLFDRPTPLEGAESGLRDWLSMFAEAYLEGLAPTERERVVAAVEDRLRPALFEDGTWIADYRRLRVVAVRTDDAP